MEVFLSYNRLDHAEVDEIRAFLLDSGIQPRIDTRDFRPGFSWISAIEDLGVKVGAFVVFFGKHGPGPVQRYEIQLALLRFFKGDCPVIPVLLPDAELEKVPPMLRLVTWIDLREQSGRADQLDRLVAALPKLDAAQAAAPPPDFIEVCPYLGLDSFGEEHQAWFFGREDFSQRLLEKVAESPLCLLAGPSGSGKSSVIQAGLIPLLRQQKVNAGQWVTISMTPTKDPFGQLAERLYMTIERDKVGLERVKGIRDLGKDLASGSLTIAETVRELRHQEPDAGRVLLIIDQFEEVLTLAPDKDRRSFAAALTRDLDRGEHAVLIGVRDDFLFEAARLDPWLEGNWFSGLVPLDRIKPEGLTRAIEGPAKAVGVDVDPVLTANLLNDLKDDPGNLPLLEFALKRLWDKRTDNRLEADSYEIGSVAKAIASFAEKELEDRLADPEQARSVQSLLCQLVKLEKQEEGRPEKYTRNRVPWSDLDENQRAIVRQLSKPGVRLLVTASEPAEGKTTVEVAHEALIRHWPRLRQWLSEDREFQFFRQKLQQLREVGGLPTPAALKEAKKWLRSRREDLSKAEIAYIKARRGSQLLRRIAIFAVALATIGAIGLIWYFADYLPREREKESALKAKFLASGDFEELVDIASQLTSDHSNGPADLAAQKRTFVLESMERQRFPGGQAQPDSDQARNALLTEKFWHPFLVAQLKSELTLDLQKELAVAFWSLDRVCWGRWQQTDCSDAKQRRGELLDGLRRLKPETPAVDKHLIPLKGDTFKMGSNQGGSDEQPVHKVSVPSFRLLRHEVTNELFGQLFPDPWQNREPNLPAVGMDWYQAYLFAAWLGGRLPTEAEWEFAARSEGDDTRVFPWADGALPTCENDLAVIAGCFGGEPLVPCSKPKGNTDQRLCDMAGNVWEWTADWFGNYPMEDQPDPWGPMTGGDRVFRGGSFSNVASIARVSYRLRRLPDLRSSNVGFRVLVAAAAEDGG